MSEFDFRQGLMLLCLLIFSVSFAALLWAAWRHHRRGEVERVNFHNSLAVEMVWTIVPCIIVLLLAWPTAKLFWSP